MIQKFQNFQKRLINSYQQKFFTSNIGKLKDTKIKLHINNSVPPVPQADCCIAFALREKAQNQIKHLEQEDIIKNVTSEATPWNNGGVRLCIDMRNANTAIERIPFPTPTVDDLIFKLKGVKYFTKLNLSTAFL